MYLDPRTSRYRFQYGSEYELARLFLLEGMSLDPQDLSRLFAFSLSIRN